MQAPVTDTSVLLDLWRNTAPVAFLATCGFAWRVAGRLVKIETLLKMIVGESGNNGELSKIRGRNHELADAVQAVESTLGRHDERLKAGGL